MATSTRTIRTSNTLTGHFLVRLIAAPVQRLRRWRYLRAERRYDAHILRDLLAGSRLP